MDNKLAHKAIKSARLAASEAKLDHDDAAYNQGRTAGQLAARADMTTEQLALEVPELMVPASYPAWNGVVDGWYESQPKDVDLGEVEAVLATVHANDAAYDTVQRMWAELKRRRGW
jgi:hypothetical protein